jgi:hypothetical protein
MAAAIGRFASKKPTKLLIGRPLARRLPRVAVGAPLASHSLAQIGPFKLIVGQSGRR